MKHYLGIIVRKNKEGFYCIEQTNYIEKLINRFGLKDAKICQIPLDQGYSGIREEQNLIPDNENYQKFIGVLLYLFVNSRPDIAITIPNTTEYCRNTTEIFPIFHCNWNIFTTFLTNIAKYFTATLQF